MVLATLLVSFAVILYLVQANASTAMQMELNQIRADRSQLNAVNAQLLVQADGLKAEHRINSLATTKLHMQSPSLASALWLTVTVKPKTPRMPAPPRLQTGPLNWMETTWQEIRDSL